MRRACCALTRSMFSSPACENASSTACLVISWNTTRSYLLFLFPLTSFNSSRKCHAIASPSLSGSVASTTVSDSLQAFFNLLIFFLDLSATSYSGAKLFSTSTPSFFVGRSRTCPIEASITYSFPKSLVKVFAFVGDSTITSLVISLRIQ